MTIPASDSATDQMVSPSQTPGYSKLGVWDNRLAQIGERPRYVCYVATAFAVLIAWAWTFFQTAGLSYYSDAALGPGGSLFEPILRPIALWAKDFALLDTLLRLCSPQIALDASISTFAVIALMWLSMSVAMMLPSAAPMLRTYGDIAHVARSKGEQTVPLVVLALGYLSVWLVFAVMATLLQMVLIASGAALGPSVPTTGAIGGAVLLFAGIYQFSSLKDACLEKCRNPFNTLFAQWTDQAWGVFKLGGQQGMFCVGCCWALMLIMLVVGTMNVAWMAFFTLFAIVEKSGKGKVTSHVTGGILLLWGGIMLVLSFGTA